MTDTSYADALRHLNPVVEVPQQLVLEVAVGLDTLAEICARYGIDDPDDIELLRNNPLFKRQVRQAEAELRKDGTTFRMRAAHAAEDMLGDIWRRAVQKDVPLTQKLEAFRVLAKMADLEPKPSALPGGAGSGFSVTISLPGQAATIVAQAPAPAAPAPFVPVNEHNVLEMEPRRRNADLELPADWDD